MRSPFVLRRLMYGGETVDSDTSTGCFKTRSSGASDPPVLYNLRNAVNGERGGGNGIQAIL